MFGYIAVQLSRNDQGQFVMGQVNPYLIISATVVDWALEVSALGLILSGLLL
jgi:hypothetical protein